VGTADAIVHASIVRYRKCQTLLE